MGKNVITISIVFQGKRTLEKKILTVCNLASSKILGCIIEEPTEKRPTIYTSSSSKIDCSEFEMDDKNKIHQKSNIFSLFLRRISILFRLKLPKFGR